jgi:hypothetical protein
MEIFIGVGYAVGPPVGGALFETAGFRVVFLFFMAFVLGAAVLMWVLLPTPYFRCVHLPFRYILGTCFHWHWHS